MADLPEDAEWIEGVYQIETPDPVLGGPNGIANRAAKALASRTKWLKGRIEALLDGSLTAFKATRLATARTFSFTGAASGSASFDGTSNVNVALTLSDSGVAPGSYQKVVVNVKGLVIGGGALEASDIPTLDWGKIVSGKPTTLAGYGITDALGINGTAVAAVKLTVARTLSVSGAATGSASFDGSANANIGLTLANSGVAAGTYTKISVNDKGLAVGGGGLVANDIPALDWGKIVSGKPTTLAGYGITDAYTQVQTQWIANDAIARFSAPNIQVPAFINGFADANSSRYWKANGNLYVSLDISRWVSAGTTTLVIFTLPPGFRPKIRVCGVGDWATQSPFGMGWLSWRVETWGEVVLDYAFGSTSGAGAFACQFSFCVQVE